MAKTAKEAYEYLLIAIYVRVSTEEQAKEGTSLESQVELALIKAGVPKAEVTQVLVDQVIQDGGLSSYNIKLYIDDGHTGEVLERPGMLALLDDARAGLLQKCVCLDPDRFSRKLMVQLVATDLLDKRKVEIVFVNGEYANTIEGRLFYQMRGAIAEFDKQKITRQLKEGRRRRGKQGKVLRDFQVYGYNYDPEKRALVINEAEAAVVRLMFDLFTKPSVVYKGREVSVKGINGIAVFLTEEGIPTKRRRGVWHRQVVRQMLMNRTYIGEFYQNRWATEDMLLNKYRPPEDRIPMVERPREEWIKIPCPEIIEKAQFDYAQMLLQESKRRWAKTPMRSYLLSGLIRCGECGNTMTGRRAKEWGKYIFQYTCIKSTAGAAHRGCGRKLVVEEFDAEIWDTVRAWLNQPDEIAAAVEEAEAEPVKKPFEEAEAERLAKEIEKAKAARKRLLKLFAMNDLDEDEIKQELREWKEKEEKASKQLSELQAATEEKENNMNLKLILQEAVDYYFTKNPDALTFEDRQQLIRMVVREIHSYRDRTEIHTF